MDCIHAASNDIPALSDEIPALSYDLPAPSDNQSNENEHAEYDSNEIKRTILHKIVDKADEKLLDKLIKSCSCDFSFAKEEIENKKLKFSTQIDFTQPKKVRKVNEIDECSIYSYLSYSITIKDKSKLFAKSMVSFLK